MKNLTKKILLLSIVTLFFICTVDNVYAHSNNNIKVSVIVPVYNVEPWLRECLDSLINQTLKEIEIICINDGSPDNSGEILEEYAQIDDRIIVINQENKGLSTARNKGLEIANGEYVSFVDPDDYINLNTYEIVYNKAKLNNCDIVEFGARVYKGKDDKTPFEWKAQNNRFIEVKSSRNLRYMLCNYLVTNKLYKLNIIKENNISFIPGLIYEDNYFNLMFIPHIKGYMAISECYYNYIRHGDSITGNGAKNENLEICIDAIEPVCSKWRNLNILEGNEDYLLTILIRKYFWLVEPILKEDVKSANKFVDSFGKDIYNRDVINKCNEKVKLKIDKLETYRHKI